MWHIQSFVCHFHKKNQKKTVQFGGMKKKNKHLVNKVKVHVAKNRNNSNGLTNWKCIGFQVNSSYSVSIAFHFLQTMQRNNCIYKYKLIHKFQYTWLKSSIMFLLIKNLICRHAHAKRILWRPHAGLKNKECLRPICRYSVVDIDSGQSVQGTRTNTRLREKTSWMRLYCICKDSKINNCFEAQLRYIMDLCHVLCLWTNKIDP